MKNIRHTQPQMSEVECFNAAAGTVPRPVDITGVPSACHNIYILMEVSLDGEEGEGALEGGLQRVGARFEVPSKV